MDELEPLTPGRETAPPAADEVPPAARQRIPRRAWLLAGVSIAAMAASVGLTRDRPASAAERLEAVRHFLGGATSVRFEGSHEVGEEFAGATYRTEGQLRFPGWARRVSHSGSAYEEETIRTDHGRYERLAGPGQRLVEQQWTYSSPARAARWAGDGEPDFGALLSGLGPPLDGESDRTDLIGIVGALRSPERVGDDTIRGTLPLTALFTDPRLKAAMLDGTGTVKVELTLGPGGRPERMGWRLDARRFGDRTRRCSRYGFPECIKERADIRFLEWNRPLEAYVPDLTEVDITPGVDERRLAGVPPSIALAPALVPDELLLERAEVTSDSTAGEAFCDQLLLRYGVGPAPGRGPFPSLSLRISTGPCPSPEVEFGPPGRSVVAGRHRGTVHREGVAISAAAVFDIEGIRATVEWSDLAESLVLDAVASLAPLDLATQPVYQSIPPQY